jgi:hypothetical protein
MTCREVAEKRLVCDTQRLGMLIALYFKSLT